MIAKQRFITAFKTVVVLVLFVCVYRYFQIGYAEQTRPLIFEPIDTSQPAVIIDAASIEQAIAMGETFTVSLYAIAVFSLLFAIAATTAERVQIHYRRTR